MPFHQAWGRLQPPNRMRRPLGGFLVGLLACLALLTGLPPAQVGAAPGLCVGPVCGQEISRSPTHPWQLRLRVDDQRGHHERVVVDCRDGVVSPRSGSVERGHVAAVARRACRLAPRASQEKGGSATPG